MSEADPSFPPSTALLPHLVRVELVREHRPPTARPITGPADVFELLRPHAARWDREHFLVVLLDARHRVVGIDDVAVGSPSSCPVHAREIFKAAILANASAIIAAHNHPSGDLAVSLEDRTITKRLRDAGTLLGIPVLDHLVITGSGFFSFKEAGEL